MKLPVTVLSFLLLASALPAEVKLSKVVTPSSGRICSTKTACPAQPFRMDEW